MKRRPPSAPRPANGRSLGPPQTSVFINCPFDSEFLPLFDSLVFAVVACGFTPRSAIETGTVSDSRIYRICNAMFSSRYSIHDLTRCKGEGDSNLARFNMPLELGFAMSRRFLAKAVRDSHDWLVLLPEGHEYTKFISDLGAYDAKTHRGTAGTIIPPVVNWLRTRPDAPLAPFPDAVIKRLPAFGKELDRLRTKSGGELPWSDVILIARKHAKKLSKRIASAS